MYDLVSHLHRQAAFSRATFGPGRRTEGVIDHIESEFDEIRKAEFEQDIDDKSPMPNRRDIVAEEWTDVAILGLDGLLRAIAARNPTWNFEQVAQEAVRYIANKQCRNELRQWPDWRGFSQDTKIEHDRKDE